MKMNCGIVVNDSNATAVAITGGASVTSTAFSVAGGYTINNGGSATPSPVSGATQTQDPFASVSGPTAGTCNYTNYSPGWGNWTLNPGTYCGGITINNGATATFNPGTYIIQGGGINFGAGLQSPERCDVLSHWHERLLRFGDNQQRGQRDTFAQTSGAYLGILFFQDRSITSSNAAAFAGGASMQLTGSLYFPTTSVSYSNGTSGTGNTAVVAKQISFCRRANLVYDPTGLKTGLLTKTVALLE